jgi:hypothetical protein
VESLSSTMWQFSSDCTLASMFPRNARNSWDRVPLAQGADELTGGLVESGVVCRVAVIRASASTGYRCRHDGCRIRSNIAVTQLYSAFA